MGDLFEAISTSIQQYMNMDQLTPRKQKMLRDTYDKFAYNIDAVDSLLELDVEKKDAEE